MATISYEQSIEQLSHEGRLTLAVVNRRQLRAINAREGSTSIVFDNTYPNYNWLLAGWIVEERYMLWNNRLYRYYYDPLGEIYSVRRDVERVFEDIERSMGQRDGVLIVLED